MRILLLLSALGWAQPTEPPAPNMAALVDRFRVDRADLERFYDVPVSRKRIDRIGRLAADWLERLDAVPFDALDRAGMVDYLALRVEVEHEQRRVAHRTRRVDELVELAPFAAVIVKLEEDRRAMLPAHPLEAAETLESIADGADDALAAIKESTDDRRDASVAQRAADDLRSLRRTLDHWFSYHDGYDPEFGWWCRAPMKRAEAAVEKVEKHLRRDVAGVRGERDDPIVGDPIGRDALLDDLRHEMIVYSPEELIEIGEREFRWCEEQFRLAADELGHDDWRDALEYVKTLNVAPGDQDDLIRQLAVEAIAFLDERDLVTIPELCRETWRIEMMSPQRQRTSPFFLYGGQEIIVSYPTDAMSHEEKLMSMRANATHFSRATVQHELIPGHHLQGFMAARYATHRRMFRTPFLGEGWALYWEMRLWDLGFPRSPEDRIGMLFWRMHRCARILVSLGFHLGTMSTREMIDLLVDRVGHERDSATAEVRRYVGGAYSPLYQCAYLIGGLQLMALYREVVVDGGMSERAFHDAVLRQNSIPVELIRLALTDHPIQRDHEAAWRF